MCILDEQLTNLSYNRRTSEQVHVAFPCGNGAPRQFGHQTRSSFTPYLSATLPAPPQVSACHPLPSSSSPLTSLPISTDSRRKHRPSVCIRVFVLSTLLLSSCCVAPIATQMATSQRNRDYFFTKGRLYYTLNRRI